MKIYLMLIFVVIFTINAIKTNKVVYTKSDELTLCNQLMYDVYYLKEENIAVHKRINHHVKEAKNNYGQMTCNFSATLGAQNVQESSQSSAHMTTMLSRMNERIQLLEYEMEFQKTMLANQMDKLEYIIYLLIDSYNHTISKPDYTNLTYPDTNLERLNETTVETSHEKL